MNTQLCHYKVKLKSWAKNGSLTNNHDMVINISNL